MARAPASTSHTYECPICHKGGFGAKKSVIRHIRGEHEGVTHQCPFPGCRHSSKQRANVNQHFNTMHTNAKPFSCSTCFHSYDSEIALNRHKRRQKHQDTASGQLTFLPPAVIATGRDGIRTPALSGGSRDSSARPITPISNTESLSDVRMQGCFQFGKIPTLALAQGGWVQDADDAASSSVTVNTGFNGTPYPITDARAFAPLEDSSYLGWNEAMPEWAYANLV